MRTLRYIIQTLEVSAAASLICIAPSILFGVFAHRSAGRSRTVWTWLAVAAGLLALVPSGLVIYAVNHEPPFKGRVCLPIASRNIACWTASPTTAETASANTSSS